MRRGGRGGKAKGQSVREGERDRGKKDAGSGLVYWRERGGEGKDPALVRTVGRDRTQHRAALLLLVSTFRRLLPAVLSLYLYTNARDRPHYSRFGR